MAINIVKNITTRRVIADDFIICKSFFLKMRGLMFSKKRTLIFEFDREKRVSLHMLFVFFPIWAIYMNQNKEVIFIKKLYPFISMVNPKKKAKYVMEVTEKKELIVGDRLDW